MSLGAVRTVIPSEGGTIFVDAETHFSFTPETSGLWTIDASGGEWDTITIITDSYGSFLTPIETGSWWNEHATLYLLEGVEYVIWVSNFWFDDFFLDLVIMPYEEMTWDWDDELEWDWDEDWEWGTIIPAEGGSFSLDEEHRFLFTPDAMGSWTIQIAGGRGWNDLSISDASQSFWVSEWDTSSVSMHLAPGVEYTIDAWASWDASGAYLQVSPTYVIRPHGGALVSRRVVQEAEFNFTPSETGYWIISTSNAMGSTDPFLWLLDNEGNVIAQDDDGGEGLNALIKIYLEAGTEYVIRAGFFAGGGEYILNVRMAGGEQAGPELVVLPPPRFM